MFLASDLEFDKRIRWRVVICFTAVSNSYLREGFRLPDAAQANKRDSGSRDSAFLVNLIKYVSLNEVCVTTEGYDDGRVRRSLWSFCESDVISVEPAWTFTTYQKGHGDETEY